MLKNINFSIVLLALSVALLPGVSFADEVPPGCQAENSNIIGGCHGKSQIEAVGLEAIDSAGVHQKYWSPPCLSLTVNNCNGGILNVQNQCNANLQLGDLIILSRKPTDPEVDIELSRDQSGVHARFSNGNVSYAPATSDNLAIDGRLGDKPLTLTYTKTGPLCK